MLVPALLLLLAVDPVPPTWFVEGTNTEMVVKFDSWMRMLPDDKKPLTEAAANCFWAAYQEAMEIFFLGQPKLSAAERAVLMERHRVTKKYMDDKCGGPGGGDALRGRQAIQLVQEMLGATLHRSTGAPFPLPPLPDRAGGDLGDPLLPMFLTLEARLAAGGHRLDEGGRACAWTSSALAAAQAVQRTPGATPGIAAGARVLEAEQATRCRGAALAQKEAAWAWIRANPGATQPLVVPLRATSAGPALGPADGALWLATALLVLGPEAWPAYLVLLPSAP